MFESELKPSYSAHSYQDSVENIIKKYSFIDRNDKDTNSNLMNKSNVTTKSTRAKVSENYVLHSIMNSNNRIFDDHLYDFIANYCKEEIKKEVSANSSMNTGNGCQKECLDKATYCRPVFNLYNRDFILKTLQRNAKLTRLIKKLITNSQREKKNEAWNNFINILKIKHNSSKVFDDASVNEEKLDRSSSQIINSSHVDELCWQSSKQLVGLLEDVYGNSMEREEEYQDENDEPSSPLFLRYPFCYPTSSVGRLTLLRRQNERLCNSDKQKKLNEKIRNRYQSKYYIHVEKDKTTEPVIPHSVQGKLRNMTVQTKHNVGITRDYSRSNDCYIGVRPIEPEQTQTLAKSDSVKNMTLKEIENKLELLINSINTLIGEFRMNNAKTISKPEMNNQFNHLRNVVVGSNIDQKYNYSSKVFNSESILTKDKCNIFFERCSRENADIKKINEIFRRELGDNASSNKTCAVQITFEVPTKEIYTEITKSLSKTHNDVRIEEIISPEPCTERITIAVNTDPMNISTLLSISTLAMNRLLSYLPNINYYLSRFHLQLPSVGNRFICNICGAKFTKTSELSNHIQNHDLGKAKDCCVCRHVLDLSDRPMNVYNCRYCGQCFVRAYCCELHQKACGRRHGKTHGVTSSNLLILR